MIIKWHKNVAKFKCRKVVLDQDILKADVFKDWVVLVTRFKMFFYGKEDYIIPTPALNVVFTDDFVFYHCAVDKNIYKLSHPLDIEEFVFYSPFFVLFDVLQNNNLQIQNHYLFVLEKNNCYVVKHKKIYYLEIKIEEKGLSYSFVECSLEDFMRSSNKGSFVEDSPNINTKKNEEINKDAVNLSKISSSIDEKLNMLKFQSYYKVCKYKHFLILIHENVLIFIDVFSVDCLKYQGFKPSKKVFENIDKEEFTNPSLVNLDARCKNQMLLLYNDTFIFNKKIEFIRRILLDLGNGRRFIFLQVENRLFYEKSLLNHIDPIKWANAFVCDKFMQNYFQPFWGSLNKTDLKVFYCLDSHHILKLITEKLEVTEYNFSDIKLESQIINKINLVLEKELMKYETVQDFYSKIEKYDSFGEIPIILSCKRLMSSELYLLDSNRYEDLLNVSYSRIFKYNNSLIGKINFDKIRNLAYLIIYLEEKKEKLNSRYMNIRIWKDYKKIFFKYFEDTRMDEVYSIFFESIRTFELDENDIEDKKEKFYIIRLSCNVGKSFAFVNCFQNNSINSLEPLKFPLLKNQELLNIEVKAKGWLNWPSFSHSCSYFLIFRNDRLLTQKYIENTIKKFNKINEEDEFLFAGMLYSFVLIKKFKDIKLDDIKEHINEELPLISMIILIGIGLNNKKQRLEDFEELCYSLIKQDNHPFIKIGSVIGLSYLFMNTQNSFFKEFLLENLKLRGVIKSEKHNKNNIWHYDKTYRIVLTFALSLCMGKSNIEVYEYIRLDDKLCELLLNGIVLWGSETKKHKEKFERNDFDHPEELFYSEFFILGLLKRIDFERICDDVENDIFDEELKNKENVRIGNQVFKVIKNKDIKDQNKCIINNLYRHAGRIFYIGVSSITNNREISDEFINKMISFCLKIEKIMLEEKEYKILFDYILISLSLIRNSSCDLEILRILRRQIKRIEVQKLSMSKTDYIFTSSGIKKETYSFLSFGEIELYKMCIGVLNLGLSKLKISEDRNTLYNIITTFYISWPISAYDQEYFTLLRYNLLLSTESCFNPKFNYFYNFYDTSKRFVTISRYFKEKLKILSEADKKCVIDLLSDYYENYTKNNEYIIDIEHFKDLVIRCK